MNDELLFAVYPSRIGYIRIEHKNKRLTRLQITPSEPSYMGVPDGFTEMVIGQIREYLEGQRHSFDLPIDLGGCTPFCQRVYSELCKIPYGTTNSYKQVAQAIANPKAARAIGMANNRNPIHIVIPCHRVIGAKGELTGYAAGVGVKEQLLSLERDRCKAAIF
ncbi:MAG: methylated-DNA--[protein]-cysteine S-methyltransferase [Rikenellaceae bacterium]